MSGQWDYLAGVDSGTIPDLSAYPSAHSPGAPTAPIFPPHHLTASASDQNAYQTPQLSQQHRQQQWLAQHSFPLHSRTQPQLAFITPLNVPQATLTPGHSGMSTDMQSSIKRTRTSHTGSANVNMQFISSPAGSPTTPGENGLPPRHNSASAPAVHQRSPPVQPAKLKRNATHPEDPVAQPHGKSAYSAASVCAKIEPGGARGKERVPHNLVERRYRENLNSQIESLRLATPSLSQDQSLLGPSDPNDWTTTARGPSKAMVISAATEYIGELKTELENLRARNDFLQGQVAQMQQPMQQPLQQQQQHNMWH